MEQGTLGTDLFLNYFPVDLPSRDVVIARECDIKISLIVAQVEINLASIVEDVHLACSECLDDLAFLFEIQCGLL